MKTTDLPQKLDKCYYINSSQVKVVTVGMTITTFIARINQEWKSRATGNIEHKKIQNDNTPPPSKKKIQQQKNNTKLQK